MDYKKHLEGIDWEKLLSDVKAAPYKTDYPVSTSPTSRIDEPSLASRVKMGTSFDRFNVLTAFRAKDI